MSSLGSYLQDDNLEEGSESLSKLDQPKSARDLSALAQAESASEPVGAKAKRPAGVEPLSPRLEKRQRGDSKEVAAPSALRGAPGESLKQATVESARLPPAAAAAAAAKVALATASAELASAVTNFVTSKSAGDGPASGLKSGVDSGAGVGSRRPGKGQEEDGSGRSGAGAAARATRSSARRVEVGCSGNPAGDGCKSPEKRRR